MLAFGGGGGGSAGGSRQCYFDYLSSKPSLIRQSLPTARSVPTRWTLRVCWPGQLSRCNVLQAYATPPAAGRIPIFGAKRASQSRLGYAMRLPSTDRPFLLGSPSLQHPPLPMLMSVGANRALRHLTYRLIFLGAPSLQHPPPARRITAIGAKWASRLWLGRACVFHPHDPCPSSAPHRYNAIPSPTHVSRGHAGIPAINRGSIPDLFGWRWPWTVKQYKQIIHPLTRGHTLILGHEPNYV